MIKGQATIGGKRCIVIGLSRRNCDKLLTNQPIMFDGSLVGLAGVHVVVFGGESEEEIVEDLRCITGMPPVPVDEPGEAS